MSADGARAVRIEKLAPTGEGIARTTEGVGFVDGALPGELVATTLYEVRKRFWRGSLRAVLEPSPDRVAGPHAGCAGCDWAHFAPAPRGRPSAGFSSRRCSGSASSTRPGSARCRSRRPRRAIGCARACMAAGGEPGYFAPGTHRVVSAAACEAIAAPTRALLPGTGEVIASTGAAVSELATLEDLPGARRLVRATVSGDPARAAELGLALSGLFQGVRVWTADGKKMLERGARFLDLTVGGRAFDVSVDSFFQGNRFLVADLFADVLTEAGRAAPGTALDAFGGVGLFAGALAEAGHRVVSVEADAERGRGRAPHEGALEGRRTLGDRGPDHPRPVPPRGRPSVRAASSPIRPARASARSWRRSSRGAAKKLFLYVSCDPATLARDLPAILAEGFRIRNAKLYDLFALTHRVEALVALERAA